MSGHKLIVGAVGWDHPAWAQLFYPDDLPEEWRLSYYANEFSGVLVPARLWQQVDTEICEAWCDEVPDDFRFYFETLGIPGKSGSARLLQQAFGAHWGGWSGASVEVDCGESWDLRLLRRRFERLLSLDVDITPGFFLQGAPPDIERMRQARLLAEMI